MLAGAEKLMHFLEQRLDVQAGDTTNDEIFTLTEVECLGSCDTAPVMQINNEPYHDNLDECFPEQILQDIKTRSNTS